MTVHATQTCDKCYALIPVGYLLDHEDWHMRVAALTRTADELRRRVSQLEAFRG